MKITYYTHSTILLEINNKNIIVDPFFTNNPIIKYNYLEKIIKKINIDYIFVTHAHYDHTIDVEKIYKKFNSIIISNYEICRYFSKKGCKTFSINFGSFIKINSLFYIKYVYALHSSSFNDGSYGGNPGGFIIKYNNKIIYISGDTYVFRDMKYFYKNLFINLSILPIGGRYTMDVKDAYYASCLLKCNNILGVHYNTFPEIKINKNKAISYFKKRSKKLFLLKKEDKIYI
ncbi:MAG: metal-dependent hydrolase [Candidatus Shikimatogenerans bostrichidophilus]|nr:MAG: metal-dependent hydrolase [Candidatus Shikimatogenerans bostrichidophilus]